jgi:hypothetical protein
MKPLRQGPTPQPRTNRQRKPYTQKKLAEPNPQQSKPGDTVLVKKPRASQSKASPTPIQCLTCKQTDVPLILGGSAFFFYFRVLACRLTPFHQGTVVPAWRPENVPSL